MDIFSINITYVVQSFLKLNLERERNIDLFFHLFMYSSVDFCMYPDGIKPATLAYRDENLTELLGQSLCSIVFIYTVKFMPCIQLTVYRETVERTLRIWSFSPCKIFYVQFSGRGTSSVNMKFYLYCSDFQFIICIRIYKCCDYSVAYFLVITCI